mgnify:CR=1 FL=1
MDTLLLGLIWFAVFLLSTTLHEAAHAFVALKFGDPTAYQAGQVTLDPIPHIRREPLGMVLVPVIFFVWSGFSWMLGWASAPYDPLWARRYPQKAALMALAGPLSNLLLVLIAALCIHIGIYFDAFYRPDKMASIFTDIVGAHNEGLPDAMATLFSIMFSLNMVLFIFNLLPFPPLDGSALFPLYLKEETALKIMEALHQPGVSLVGLLLAWFFFDKVFPPIHLVVINLLYPGYQYQISENLSTFAQLM